MAQLPNRVEDTLLNRVYVFNTGSGKWHIEDSVTGRPGNFVSEATVQAAYAAANVRRLRPTVTPAPAPAPAPAAAPSPPPPAAAAPPASPPPPPARPVAAAAPTPPTPPTPPPGVVTAPQETGMTRTTMFLGTAAAVVILILGVALGNALFSGKTTVAGTYTSDDLDGKIDGRIKKAVEPIVGDVATLKRDTKALKDGFESFNSAMDDKFKRQQEDVLVGVKKLLDSKSATPPAAPAAPAVSALAQQRMAMVQRECLPEDQQNVTLNSLGDGLDQSSFDAQIAHCKANKMAKQRMVSPPPAAGRPQVAQNDPQDDPEATDEDQDAQAPGQPRAQPVGYGGGHRQGKRRCPPGTEPAGSFGCVGQTITNRAETRVFDTNIRSGCVQGATQTIWKKGVDQQGRNVRYKIDQHTECRGQHRQ